MKIAIDIDEVVVEFFREYLELFNKRFNTTIKFEDMDNFHIWEVCNISKEDSLKLVNEFYRSDDFFKMELVDGVKEALEELREENEIHFITSRPISIKEKTQIFLGNLFQNYNFGLHFSGGVWGESRTKGEICKELEVDFFVEDNFDYAIDSARKGIKTFLMDKPWNQNGETHENLIRVKTWPEIMEKLK